MHQGKEQRNVQLPKFFSLKSQNPAKPQLIDVVGLWNKTSFQEHISDDVNRVQIHKKSTVKKKIYKACRKPAAEQQAWWGQRGFMFTKT